MRSEVPPHPALSVRGYPHFPLRPLGIGTTRPGRANDMEDPRPPNERSLTGHGLKCRGLIHRFSSSVYPLGLLVAASVAMGVGGTPAHRKGIADMRASIRKLGFNTSPTKKSRPPTRLLFSAACSVRLRSPACSCTSR